MIKLNLAFIEDWWYEIASAITKNDPTHEVVIKKFYGDKPNFEWLFIKILILFILLYLALYILLINWLNLDGMRKFLDFRQKLFILLLFRNINY